VRDSYEAPSDVSYGQAATNLLWPEDKKLLRVHILNLEELIKVGLKQQDIIDWANKWRKDDAIPEFELTKKADKAEIRVQIGE